MTYLAVPISAGSLNEARRQIRDALDAGAEILRGYGGPPFVTVPGFASRDQSQVLGRGPGIAFCLVDRPSSVCGGPARLSCLGMGRIGSGRVTCPSVRRENIECKFTGLSQQAHCHQFPKALDM